MGHPTGSPEKLDRWAADVVEEVYREWKENFSHWEAGFSVFNSPVREEPELMILGYQPGGTAEDFQRAKKRYQSGEFHLPEGNELTTSGYRLAQEMRRLFEGRREMLEQSVFTNLIFFRSPDTGEWGSRDSDRVNQAEEFCFQKTREILERLNPKRILVIGVTTFDRFIDVCVEDPNTQPSTIEGENGRVLCSADVDSTKMVGMKHLTGARPSSEEFEILRAELWPRLGA